MGFLYSFGDRDFMKNVLKGVVLAGGKSVRFGEDKALAVICGERLIEKPVRLLQSLGLETLVVANSSRDYSFLNCRIENDRVANKGPLGGIDRAFITFPDADLLVLTCDMPNITAKALEILMEAWRADSKVAIFQSTRPEFQPFPGIYSGTLKESVADCLRHDELSMQTFLKAIRAKTLVRLTGPLKRLFANINTKEDL